MPAHSRRTEKLDVRLTPQAKRTIATAAAVSQRSVSDFVLQSALERAEEMLADRHVFVLDDKQWAAFQAALEAPPRALPRLKRLLERKAPWE
jgi:uncharacterized protein (DUF1778 family)